jgi:CHRD domain
MTRLLCGAAVAAALLISASPSSAQVVTMTANLNGGEETPILNTGAVGTAVVSVDPVNEEISVTLSVFNLPTGTTAGHIHIGPKGIAGPVVINFPIPTGRTGDLPLSFRLGAAAFVPRPEIGIVTMADAIQSIVGGNAYVNVHTSQYPAGEIRGQLSVVVRPQ